MAKRQKKATPPKEVYEYINAKVSGGELTLEYKVSHQLLCWYYRHDEDVSEWTDDEIRGLIIGILDVPPEEQHLIGEIHWN